MYTTDTTPHALAKPNPEPPPPAAAGDVVPAPPETNSALLLMLSPAVTVLLGAAAAATAAAETGDEDDRCCCCCSRGEGTNAIDSEEAGLRGEQLDQAPQRGFRTEKRNATSFRQPTEREREE